MITDLPTPTQSLDQDAAFRLLFYGNPLPMWVFDNDPLRILAVNEAAIRRYGWSREECTTLTIEDIRPPEDVTHLRACRETVHDAGSPGRKQTSHGRER